MIGADLLLLPQLFARLDLDAAQAGRTEPGQGAGHDIDVLLADRNRCREVTRQRPVLPDLFGSRLAVLDAEASAKGAEGDGATKEEMARLDRRGRTLGKEVLQRDAP